jgi:hypothetical protein
MDIVKAMESRVTDVIRQHCASSSDRKLQQLAPRLRIHATWWERSLPSCGHTSCASSEFSWTLKISIV